MTPYYDHAGITIYHGDCLAVLPELSASSVDAVVTDPPYGLSFMGKNWDHGVPGAPFWTAVSRVAKPGAHLLAFGGTRTFHRLACAIEDAGWEIRDTIMWVYGSGFPKSLNVGDGWGTALKPAWEPIIVARKPLDGTVAENVQRYGTGAINIDGCRIGTEKRPLVERADQYRPENFDLPSGSRHAGSTTIGRWPANLIHDGSDEVVRLFPNVKAGVAVRRNIGVSPHGMYSPGGTDGDPRADMGYRDSGSAARFFYCAKASRAERDEGCDDLPPQRHADRVIDDGAGGDNPRNRTNTPQRNYHPTVKPVALMRYLCRLVTPRGGVVLDPFCGSGSTGVAALRERVRFLGIEREIEYCTIAVKRLAQDVLPLTAEPEPVQESLL